MARNNLIATALVIGVAAFACAGGGKKQTEDNVARELLFRTLVRTTKNNVIALITQRSPEGDGSFQRIQVQIHKDGRLRQTVIYPLSLQGVEKIDDGKQSATCLPDEKLILVQESPRTLPDDSASRINLTVKNYGLTLAGTTTVAGQRAAIVVAKPRYAGMETRRYHIDERTGFLLKLETVDSKGVVKMAFQAQQVTYPASISASVFSLELDKREDYRIITQKRAGFLDSPGKKFDPIGFEPVFPDQLPFGFDIQDVQINDSGRHKSVAVRITDGLVKGTVYQYSLAVAKNMKEMPGTTIMDGNGIRFVIAADVPEPIRKKMLTHFITTAKKAEIDFPILGLLQAAELSQAEPTLTAPEELILEIRHRAQSFEINL